jgi:hypothetical protein
MMHTDRQLSAEAILENLPVRIVSCKIAQSFVTEIEIKPCGCLLARGIADSADDSLTKALETLSGLTSYNRSLELTVGG